MSDNQMYTLNDEADQLSLAGGAKASGKYVALTVGEKKYLVEKNLIVWCGHCGAYHRSRLIGWDRIDEELAKYVPPEPSQPRRGPDGKFARRKE